MAIIYSKKLVTSKAMLEKAKKNKYAVGHFNINNLEWTKSLLEIANETKTPIILGASEGAIRYMGGYKLVSAMVNALLEELKISVPVALHLDHGQSVAAAKKAIDSGFSSVMYDGSHTPFASNYKNTQEVLKYAKSFGVSVEAEIGSIGGNEDGVIGAGEIGDPEEAKKMSALGLTMLAAGIGNIHGVYPTNWKGLNFEALAAINNASKLPLVLHGGSGIPNAQITKAIKLGISKVNVNTECQIAFSSALRKYYEQNLDKKDKGFDPRSVLKGPANAIKDTFVTLSKLFGSYGKA